MSWPAWTDALKDRFIADEASVFLLVGDIHAAKWSVEGSDLDAANVLVRFLARSRPVVGVLRTGVGGGLRFPTFADESKFDQLVDAALLMSGQAVALSAREPTQALGRIWQALTTHGVDQAYMVVDVDKLLPRRSKRIDPIPTAPTLFEWPEHPTLRQSNNLVVLLTTDLDAVRPEMVEAASVIRLDGEPVLDSATEAALEHLQADVSTSAPPAIDAVAPSAPVAGEPPAPLATAGYEVLEPLLQKALTTALLQHSEQDRDAKLPVMHAVALVMEAGGAPWHGLTFRLGEEGEALVDG